MSTYNIKLTDAERQTLETLAKTENVSLEEYICMILTEKATYVTEDMYLQMRALRADKAKFRAAMAKVGNDPVSEEDRI